MSSYDYVFLAEVPDEYTCPICSSPMKEPVQTKCGHRFRRLCLEKSMERMQECPIDRGDLDADTPTDIFPDKASERKILDFEVKCPNDIDGCQWTGELRNVEAHEASCDFVKVKCGKVNCSAIVFRWNLQHHKSELCPRRTVSCIHCGAVYVWCLEQEHFDACQNFPCCCPQGCGVRDVPKSEMETHLELECGHTEVDCKYRHIGCQVKIQRNDLHQHLQANVEAHLNMACERLQMLENETMIRQKELEDLVTTHSQLRELDAAMNDVLQRMNNIERSMKTVTSKLQSKTSKELTLFEARIAGNERKGELRDEMMENYRGMQNNLQGEIEAIRQRIQELPTTGSASTDRRLQAGALRKSTWHLPTSVTPWALPLPRPAGVPQNQRRISGVDQLAEMTDDNRSASSANETQGPSRELSNNGHDGNRFVWKFTQFNDCLQKAKDGTNAHYYSEPFLTGPYGYKMRVELHPNGLSDGLNTHLSIFVRLMKSEYDGILPWPFDKTIQLLLLISNPVQNCGEIFRCVVFQGAVGI